MTMIRTIQTQSEVLSIGSACTKQLRS